MRQPVSRCIANWETRVTHSETARAIIIKSPPSPLPASQPPAVGPILHGTTQSQVWSHMHRCEVYRAFSCAEVCVCFCRKCMVMLRATEPVLGLWYFKTMIFFNCLMVGSICVGPLNRWHFGSVRVRLEPFLWLSEETVYSDDQPSKLNHANGSENSFPTTKPARYSALGLGVEWLSPKEKNLPKGEKCWKSHKGQVCGSV